MHTHRRWIINSETRARQAVLVPSPPVQLAAVKRPVLLSLSLVLHLQRKRAVKAKFIVRSVLTTFLRCSVLWEDKLRSRRSRLVFYRYSDIPWNIALPFRNVTTKIWYKLYNCRYCHVKLLFATEKSRVARDNYFRTFSRAYFPYTKKKATILPFLSSAPLICFSRRYEWGGS